MQSSSFELFCGRAKVGSVSLSEDEAARGHDYDATRCELLVTLAVLSTDSPHRTRHSKNRTGEHSPLNLS